MKKQILIMMSFVFGTAVIMLGCGNTNPEKVNNETVESVTLESETTSETEIDKLIETIIEETETVMESVEETKDVEESNASKDTITETKVENTTETITKSEYTYTDLDKTMYAKQNVNIRELPTSDSTKLGAFVMNDTVKVTGQCNENNWYRIDYNGKVAYVSNSYLVNDKVVVAEQTNTTSSTTSNSQPTVETNTSTTNTATTTETVQNTPAETPQQNETPTSTPTPTESEPTQSDVHVHSWGSVYLSDGGLYDRGDGHQAVEIYKHDCACGASEVVADYSGPVNPHVYAWTEDYTAEVCGACGHIK